MSSNLINVIACDQYYFYISNVWEINIWIDSVFFFTVIDFYKNYFKYEYYSNNNFFISWHFNFILY